MAEKESANEIDSAASVSSATSEGGPSNAGSSSAQEPLPQIQQIAAFGDVEGLQKLARFNPAVTHSTDPQGYYPLQWAALNNRVKAVIWLLENGADVHAVDSQKQTALHWAGVRGCLAAAHVLLNSGANWMAQDERGYNVAHVAAQYGHTSFLHHMAVHWSMDMDTLDIDARSPLHWAAYKGFSNCVRFLLYLDVDPMRQDSEGCTPLHWAAIKGQGECVARLAESSPVKLLDMTDNTGSTAQDLAKQKNHHDIAALLVVYKERLDPTHPYERSYPFKLIRQLPLKQAWVLWGVAICMVVMYIHFVVLFPEAPPHPAHEVDSETAVLSWLAMGLSSLSMYFLLRASTDDPGYVQGSTSSNNTKANLNHPALWSGKWSHICVQCKVVRPLRAKHCNTCNRCVCVFDHHNGLIGNCVGRKNRRELLMCLVFGAAAMAISAVVAVDRLVHLTHLDLSVWEAPGILTWLVGDLLGLAFMGVLSVIKLHEASVNMTTYEVVSKETLTYLMAPDGGFSNPFDKGFLRNMHEMLVQPVEEQTEVVCMNAPELDARSVSNKVSGVL